MSALVFLLVILAVSRRSDGAWCVCRPDVNDAMLQKTIDYACGAGADCNPIQQTGACFNPNSVRAHCSYAANSYYQRKGQTQQACDFSSTAVLTNSDPSTAGCSYPATISAAGTSTTPSTNTNPGFATPSTPGTPGTTTATPGSATPSTLTPGTLTPGTFTPTTGSGGVLGGGLGPSGNGAITDTSNCFLSKPSKASVFLSTMLLVLALLRN